MRRHRTGSNRPEWHQIEGQKVPHVHLSRAVPPDGERARSLRGRSLGRRSPGSAGPVLVRRQLLSVAEIADDLSGSPSSGRICCSAYDGQGVTQEFDRSPETDEKEGRGLELRV